MPSSFEEDGYDPDSDCLLNNGAERVTVAPTVGTTGNTGGGSTTVSQVGTVGYYGSGSVIHVRECWRIVTRDGDGKVIGDSIQCFIVG